MIGRIKMPYLSKILIYPIKSLDGVEVAQSTLLKGGALAGDREFALFDPQGNVVNGKRTAKIHRIRSGFDLDERTITVWVDGVEIPQTFHLDRDRPALEQWFSHILQEPITLRQDLHMGFPDDVVASGPTLVATETLETVASWFPGLCVEEIRRRFRTNLEIGGAEPFWEDHLFCQVGELQPFQVGGIILMGSHPCQRCIVPTRDTRTGDPTAQFQAHFATQRQTTLPLWANSERFNHFYKLTINTKVSPTEAGKLIQIGDPLKVLGRRAAKLA